MPEMKYYEVTEVRTVRVVANNAQDAGNVAAIAFNDGQDANGKIDESKKPYDFFGNTRSRIRTISLDVKLNN